MRLNMSWCRLLRRKGQNNLMENLIIKEEVEVEDRIVSLDLLKTLKSRARNVFLKSSVVVAVDDSTQTVMTNSKPSPVQKQTHSDSD